MLRRNGTKISQLLCSCIRQDSVKQPALDTPSRAYSALLTQLPSASHRSDTEWHYGLPSSNAPLHNIVRGFSAHAAADEQAEQPISDPSETAAVPAEGTGAILCKLNALFMESESAMCNQ